MKGIEARDWLRKKRTDAQRIGHYFADVSPTRAEIESLCLFAAVTHAQCCLVVLWLIVPSLEFRRWMGRSKYLGVTLELKPTVEVWRCCLLLVEFENRLVLAPLVKPVIKVRRTLRVLKLVPWVLIHEVIVRINVRRLLYSDIVSIYWIIVVRDHSCV